MFTEKPLKPLLNFNGLKGSDLSPRGMLIYNGLSADPVKFDKPTYPLPAFKDLIERHAAANSVALDGSTTAKAVRNQLRAELIAAMRQLGHYVESCHLDRAAFVATGFEPQAEIRSRGTELPADSGILGLEQGKSGELLVSLKSAARAIHYEIRYAEIVEGVAPVWATVLTTSTRPAPSVNNLTPGRIYTFAVRVFGRQGHTDWSETASRMCI